MRSPLQVAVALASGKGLGEALALPPLRSFRLRLALWCSLSAALVLLLAGGLMHAWIRAEGFRSLERQIEAQAHVILGQERPVRWHMVEDLVRRDGSDTVILAVLGTPRFAWVSEHWPLGMEPEDLIPDFKVPQDFTWIHAGEPAPLPPRARDVAPLDPEQDRGVVRISCRSTTAFDPERRYGAFRDGDTTLLVGISAQGVAANLARFRRDLLLASPLLLLLIGGISYAAAGRAVRSIGHLAAAMEGTHAGALGKKIEPRTADREFERLISVYNEMLQRLELSFEETRRFADNAAHELRTPLTILQGKLEAGIRSEEPGSDRQAFLVDLLDECARLKAITEKLLLLARSDAGRLDLYVQDVDLTRLLRALVGDFEAVSPELAFSQHYPPAAVIQADKALITQVLHNILSNAVKYNRRADGFVQVSLERQPDGVYRLRVANSGRPIPEAKQKRLFERFYRVDQSRSREVEGTGLGLSLARELARAHGGDIALEKSDAEATVFVVTLPEQPPPGKVFSSSQMLRPVPRPAGRA